LEETLISIDQISRGVTVMAINATRNPEQSPRIRILMGELLALIQEAEDDLETYSPSCPPWLSFPWTF